MSISLCLHCWLLSECHIADVNLCVFVSYFLCMYYDLTVLILFSLLVHSVCGFLFVCDCCLRFIHDYSNIPTTFIKCSLRLCIIRFIIKWIIERNY